MPGRIRLARASDGAALAAIYGPVVESTPISFETDPPTADEMGRRVAETLPAHPWVVCEIEGEIAGYAYATPHRTRRAYRWSVDTSVYVSPWYRRRGVGRALYSSLFAVLAAQRYVNAFAGITVPNAASVGLHASLGFEPVGIYRCVGYKLGAWHDVGWWQRTFEHHTSAPTEPLPLAIVAERPDWAELLGAGESAIRADPPPLPT